MRFFQAAIVFFIIGASASCTKNSVTGRNQFLLIPQAEILSLSRQQYATFLSQNRVVKGTRDAQKVETIGRKIAQALTVYYQQQGNTSIARDYAWEFNLVNDNAVNAWCMPGGKVVVYTGLLPVSQNDDAMAAVMGHEIAHAIAEHGNERMTQGMVKEAGGAALSVMLSTKPEATRNLFMSAYGAGSAVGILLPFSRKQELEADRFGLIFSALAGYNPDAAIEFWQRMSKASGGNTVPELLSTHPSDETRIAKIRIYAEEAKKYVVAR